MGFRLHRKGKLAYLTIPAFENTGLVKHGFSTRLGGYSTGPYESLNLGFKRADDKNRVINNYKVFCKAIDIDFKNLVASDQIHKDVIYKVTYEDRGKGIYRDSDIQAVDALITREKNVALVTYYADCVPLFFLDTKTPAIGLAHAGWRGTVQKIGQKTLREMKKQFGTQPRDVLIGIGPCINKCCYEVDQPVIDKFKQAFSYWDKLVEYKGNGKWMLDLLLANKSLLKDVGINSTQITTSDYCTSCFNDLFFSYRKDQGKTGSLAAIIQLV